MCAASPQKSNKPFASLASEKLFCIVSTSPSYRPTLIDKGEGKGNASLRSLDVRSLGRLYYCVEDGNTVEVILLGSVAHSDVHVDLQNMEMIL